MSGERQTPENDAAIAGRIMATGLHAFLADLVDAAGRTQVSIARHAGLSEKHVSQMLTGKVDGSLAAWTKLLAAAHRPTMVFPSGSDHPEDGPR